MKPLKVLAAAAAVCFSLTAAMESAWAHKGHRSRSSAHFSFGFWGPHYWGPGFWGPGYWGPGYWGPAYVPPIVVVPQEPRVYIERDDLQSPPAAAPATPAPAQWWYWCASARQYYPYVASCTEGWQRVAPQSVPGAQ